MRGGFVRAKKRAGIVRELSCKIWINNVYMKIDVNELSDNVLALHSYLFVNNI